MSGSDLVTVRSRLGHHGERSTRMSQRSLEPQVLEPQALHLRPRSHESQRVWHVGAAQRPVQHRDRSDICLEVCPDRHENFASLRAILDQLTPHARPEQRAELTKLDGYLREACPAASGDGPHSQLPADSVTFAIMRRISRESINTACVIDLSARLINAILSQVPGCARAHVDYVDRLDRPTLKVLARAMLLTEPSHSFSWVWHSESDPAADGYDEPEDDFIASRRMFLRQLVGMLSPVLHRSAEVLPLRRPPEQPGAASIHAVSAALVLQNYDACFLLGRSLLSSRDKGEVAEGLRLVALAAVNIGQLEEASHLLHLAEEITTGSGRRAHLCYLQGLIAAKRNYDLSRSTAEYERGLATLADQPGVNEDLPLEHAWLLNGLALNEAIWWRRNSEKTEHHSRAFALLREAFSLVHDGEDPARFYLRFNLLANSAFLMEMQGHYDLAIEILRKTFDFGFTESSSQKQRWRTAIGYRIGVLQYRAGRLDEACQLLREAADQEASIEYWPTHERILRALGTIALDRGAFSQAARAFSQGYALCRDARSAEGTYEHACGLFATLIREGKAAEAQTLHETLLREEGLRLIPPGRVASDRPDLHIRPSPPSPKLPAYIAEIDLEDIPTIDINRFLDNVPSRGSTGAAPWRT